MMGFNRELFAYLLQKAKGDRSLNRFGYESNVDPGYLSRLLRCQVETPPGALVLTKIAGKAHNKVTIEQLLGAAGYVEASYYDIIGENDDDTPAEAGSSTSGPNTGVRSSPEGVANDDPMVDEFLSYCKEMIERPALLDTFKQIKDLSDDKLRRVLKMIKMSAEMGD